MTTTTLLINHWALVTAYVEAYVTAGLMLGIAVAVGPDMKAFPCMSKDVRVIIMACAIAAAWVGSSIQTTVDSPLSIDPQHVHIERAVGWGFWAILMVRMLVYVLGQKLNPEVRSRLMRRWLQEEAIAKAALRGGHNPLSALADLDGRKVVLDIGGSPSLARKLASMP